MKSDLLKNYFSLSALAVSCLLGVAGCDRNQPSTAQTTAQTTMPIATKPDNTAINRNDRNTGALTPTDQSESAADLKISADIRRAVMDDKGLSTNAHNAKIITANGTVTLRGVVDNAGEKGSLETKAKAVAGVTSVDNQLTVKNP